MAEKSKEELLWNKLRDRSTEREFSFSIRCQSCGREIVSPIVLFTRQDENPTEQGRKTILEILRKREWEAARKTAYEKLLEHFSICPICERCVCDECFLISEDIDLCRDCSKKLGVPGETVYSKIEEDL